MTQLSSRRPNPDLFDQPANGNEPSGSWQRMAIFVLLFLALLAAAIYGLRLYLQQPPAEPVIIEAPADPIKIPPTDQGGLQIPYQDMLIYDQLAGANNPPRRYEKTLAPEPATLSNNAPVVLEAAPQPAPTIEQAPPASRVEPEPKPAVTTLEPKPALPQAAATEAKTEPKPVANVAGMQRLQLGAFPDQAVANRRIAALAKQENFRTIKLQTVAANINGRTFYRVQTAPLPGEQAQRLCAQLKAAGQDCMVLR